MALVLGLQATRMLCKLEHFLKHREVPAAHRVCFQVRFQREYCADKLNNDSQKVWINRKVAEQRLAQESKRFILLLLHLTKKTIKSHLPRDL